MIVFQSGRLGDSLIPLFKKGIKVNKKFNKDLVLNILKFFVILED